MSSLAIPVHVALVDDTHALPQATLAEVAAALNEQVQADFAPVWKVAATVGANPAPPPGTWAIHLQQGLDEPGALGYHADEHHQPYAMVDLTGSRGRGVADDWTVTASHELLEMLADPWGNRMHTAEAPRGWRTGPPTERVRYLLEVCDPCEATSYDIAGIAVSDFLHPPYYRTANRAKAPCSHVSDLRCRAIDPGGYVSFARHDGHWYQGFADHAGAVTFRDLGFFDGRSSLREWTDQHARERDRPL